jgi:hypothetical protein
MLGRLVITDPNISNDSCCGWIGNSPPSKRSEEVGAEDHLGIGGEFNRPLKDRGPLLTVSG